MKSMVDWMESKWCSDAQRQVYRSNVYTTTATPNKRHVSSLHKELASVSVLSAISHREEEGLVVLGSEVLVVERSAID